MDKTGIAPPFGGMVKFGVFSWQVVPDSPSSGTAQPVPAPGVAVQEASEPGGFAAFAPMLFLLPVFGLLFWQSRSQQKKQAAAVADLKKGDRVLTQSGVIGRIAVLGDRTVELEMVPSSATKITVLKSSLAGRDSDADPVKSGKTPGKP